MGTTKSTRCRRTTPLPRGCQRPAQEMDDLAVDTAIFRLRHFRKGGVQVSRYAQSQVDGGVFHTTIITNLTPDAQARIMVS
jgi:hypothetical protein